MVITEQTAVDTAPIEPAPTSVAAPPSMIAAPVRPTSVPISEPDEPDAPSSSLEGVSF